MKTSPKKHIDSLLSEARVVELRHHLEGTWRSGLFDFLEARRVVSTLSLGHLLLRFSVVNLPQKTSLKKAIKLSERRGPAHRSTAGQVYILPGLVYGKEIP